MIVASSNTIEGHRVQTIGMVSGNIVISKNSGHDFLTSVKNFLGTQNTLLADATELARREARRRMAEEADTLGADAVCAVRYAGSSFGSGLVEVSCYGTAVRFVDERADEA
jgi:uncharacterized protein YbjQ (UPF0145 family)